MFGAEADFQVGIEYFGELLTVSCSTKEASKSLLEE
jgi:hypothetical protein